MVSIAVGGRPGKPTEVDGATPLTPQLCLLISWFNGRRGAVSPFGDEVGMAKVGVDDLEKLQTLRLDAESRDELLNVASECTFVFKSPSGWASGVVMSFLFHEGAYWLTAVGDRAHARAVLADPRVTLVISNAGTRLSGRRMLAI